MYWECRRFRELSNIHINKYNWLILKKVKYEQKLSNNIFVTNYRKAYNFKHGFDNL
jgi:hypothetical protein